MFQRTASIQNLSDCKEQGVKEQKRKIRNKKHNERRKIMRFQIPRKITNSNKKHIKNLSNYTLTTAQINLLSRGLKFISMPFLAENRIKQQLLQDFFKILRGECASSTSFKGKIMNSTPSM